MTDAIEILAQHRQEHRPETGDSVCACGKWVGPFTMTTQPGSYAHHLATVLGEERRKAGREALSDAADYLLPRDVAGPDFLVYLAVTKYGTATYDPEVAEALIQRFRKPAPEQEPEQERESEQPRTPKGKPFLDGSPYRIAGGLRIERRMVDGDHLVVCPGCGFTQGWLDAIPDPLLPGSQTICVIGCTLRCAECRQEFVVTREGCSWSSH